MGLVSSCGVVPAFSYNTQPTLKFASKSQSSLKQGLKHEPDLNSTVQDSTAQIPAEYILSPATRYCKFLGYRHCRIQHSQGTVTCHSTRYLDPLRFFQCARLKLTMHGQEAPDAH